MVVKGLREGDCAGHHARALAGWQTRSSGSVVLKPLGAGVGGSAGEPELEPRMPIAGWLLLPRARRAVGCWGRRSSTWVSGAAVGAHAAASSVHAAVGARGRKLVVANGPERLLIVVGIVAAVVPAPRWSLRKRPTSPHPQESMSAAIGLQLQSPRPPQEATSGERPAVMLVPRGLGAPESPLKQSSALAGSPRIQILQR